MRIRFLIILIPYFLSAQPKPTLGTVTDDIRNLVQDSVVAEKKASDERASAAKKASVEADLRAQNAALRAQIAAKLSKDEAIRLQAGRDLRLDTVEEILKKTEADKRAALEETARQKKISDDKVDANWTDIKRAGYGVLASVIVMLFGFFVKMVTDRRHHKEETQQLTLIHSNTEKIYKQGNSLLTERMEYELEALKSFLNVSLELIAAKKHAGDNISEEELDINVATKHKIMELDAQLKRRAMVAQQEQEDANA
jgi:hypothetical protein